MRAFTFLRTAPRRPGKSISGTRWLIDGAAQVQVLQALDGNRYRVLLTHVSGPKHREGETVELDRSELHVGPAELAYFEQLVRYTFGGGEPTPHPGERPAEEPATLLDEPLSLIPRADYETLVTDYGATVADALVESWRERGHGADAARNVSDLTPEEARAIGERMREE